MQVYIEPRVLEKKPKRVERVPGESTVLTREQKVGMSYRRVSVCGGSRDEKAHRGLVQTLVSFLIKSNNSQKYVFSSLSDIFFRQSMFKIISPSL
jgi:hypothetical protein